MATFYTPSLVPSQYDPTFFAEELEKISMALTELETPWVILSAQHEEPSKRKEGMVVNADGTDWDPGSGAGLYEYIGGSWNKL